MSEGTAFLLLKGWLTVSVLAFALNELRILRRDARAASKPAGHPTRRERAVRPAVRVKAEIAPGMTGTGYSIMGVTLVMFLFGMVKGHYTGSSAVRGGFQTALVGGLAAGAAFFLARAVA
ncbi:MAG: VIT1/CCC1 transporter family protein [Geminicoccaceae bacterium]|nr:VIT1/CCC1 transporter family protein [Geminicoccaceae bacterium]